jgi:uncharacterized short protein YbdD (DUF466 family)
MITVIRSALFRWAAGLRAIAGAPDYDLYLEHMRSEHPEQGTMTLTEFSVARMRDRYDRPGSRCC